MQMDFQISCYYCKVVEENLSFNRTEILVDVHVRALKLVVNYLNFVFHIEVTTKSNFLF